MRKSLLSLASTLSLAAALALAPGASASASNAMGKVDTKRLFEQYRDAQMSQSEFKKKAESYQRKFMNRNQELQDAQREGKTKAEIDKMTKRYEAELRPEKEAVEKLDKELSAKLKRQIEAAIQDVAKAKGYSVVVDKQVVLFGGEDITDDVLKKLNK
jgi:outer membrane protein